MVVNKKQCSERVAPPGMWGSFQQHQCEKKTVVTCDGRRYCKVHSPEYIRVQDEARQKRFDHETAVRRIQYSGHMLLAACKEALEASHNPKIEKILMDAISKAEEGL